MLPGNSRKEGCLASWRQPNIYVGKTVKYNKRVWQERTHPRCLWHVCSLRFVLKVESHPTSKGASLGLRCQAACRHLHRGAQPPAPNPPDCQPCRQLPKWRAGPRGCTKQAKGKKQATEKQPALRAAGPACAVSSQGSAMFHHVVLIPKGDGSSLVIQMFTITHTLPRTVCGPAAPSSTPEALK